MHSQSAGPRPAAVGWVIGGHREVGLPDSPALAPESVGGDEGGREGRGIMSPGSTSICDPECCPCWLKRALRASGKKRFSAWGAPSLPPTQPGSESRFLALGSEAKAIPV